MAAVHDREIYNNAEELARDCETFTAAITFNSA